MGHVLISAAHKSSGKTMVSTGLVRALSARGLSVQPFKKGPDYIDPKWLGQAAGRECFNLDFNTQTNADIQALFSSRCEGADIALIEGNKGLYDGVDLEGSNSNAALAKLLRTPVILVVDASGITRGVAPLLMGYRVFDQDVDIKGVILNKVLGPRHEDKLIRAVERYTDIEVLGAIKRSDRLGVDERHIGLIPSNEHPHAQERIDLLARTVEEQVNVDRVLAIAKAAPSVPVASAPAPSGARTPDVCIAVAKDAAFGFYYPDDLDALRRAGARIVYFNALKDVYLPTCDALFLGGGFPETQMARLSSNTTLRMRIKAAIEAGLPTYAECGGLMYLSRSIIWGDEQLDMVGAIPGDALMHPRPQGRGYVHLKSTAAHPWAVQGDDAVSGDDGFPAHEFHHSTLENLPQDLTYAYDVTRGRGIDGRHDGIVMHNLVAGYAHLRDTSRCRWAEPFTQFVRRLRLARNGETSPAQVAG